MQRNSGHVNATARGSDPNGAPVQDLCCLHQGVVFPNAKQVHEVVGRAAVGCLGRKAPEHSLGQGEALLLQLRDRSRENLPNAEDLG